MSVPAIMSNSEQPPQTGAPLRAEVELLLDLDAIDLSRVVMDREQIGRWNPQRGPIVQLDGVFWHDEGFTCAVGFKDVRNDEFWVEGHFPGEPVMPGVLLVEAAAQLSSLLFYERRRQACVTGFTRIEDTVFRGKVRPGDRLIILSKVLKSNRRIFVSGCQGVVDGKIVFETKITGMVI